MTGMVPAEIPSPTSGVLWLGSFPLRAYAICIIIGIFLALWIGTRRYAARGGNGEDISEIAVWAIPFGIIGARLYHVITTPEPYFGEGGRPLDALKVWEGGLGIWGAVALGAVGAWIAARRKGIAFLDVADSLLPGVLVAQAAGRFGNYFNNEIYGPETDLPWGLRIYEWDASAGHALRDAQGEAIVKGVYHPTFLYEALWCLLLAGLIVWAERRWQLHRGQSAALYVMGYPLGRVFIELIRTDPANRILGQRVNVWISLLCLAAGAALWWWSSRRQPVQHFADRPGPGAKMTEPAS